MTHPHCQQTGTFVVNSFASRAPSAQYFGFTRFASLLLPILFAIATAAQPKPNNASSVLQRAAALMQAGNISEAEQILLQAERAYPASSQIENALAGVLTATGKLEPAGAHLEAAVKLAPKIAQYHVNLGANYFSRGRAAAAREQLEIALQLDRNNTAAEFNLGLLIMTHHDFLGALPHLEHALQLEPGSIPTSYQLAACQVFLLHYDAAVKTLEPVAKKQGVDPKLLVLLGTARAASRDDVGASAAFNQALDLSGKSGDAFDGLGKALLEVGQFSPAVDVLAFAHQHATNSYDVGFHLALAYHGLHQDQRADELVGQMSKTFDTPGLHRLAAELLEKHEEYVEAAHELQRALQEEPTEANFYALGFEFLSHWSWDAAADVFQRGLQRYSDSAQLRTGLATAYFAQSDYDSAVQALLPVSSSDGESRIAAGVLLAAFANSHGQSAAVQQHFHEALQTKPNEPWANYFYAESLLESPDSAPGPEQRAEALRLLRRATLLAPQTGEFQFGLGLALSDSGEWQHAIAPLQAALKVQPQNVEACYRLAQAYQRTGQAQLAHETLERYTTLKAKADAELDTRMAGTAKFIYQLHP